MRPDPLVSVLIPVFDAERTLPASLRSIQRQTEPRFECVVVDDGSRDASLGIAQRFADRDERFRALALPHRGVAAASNAGLEHCRGRIVARMDADDLMHRERLARQIAALDAAPDLDAVGTHVRLFPRGDLGEGMRAYEGWLSTVDSPERVRDEMFVESPVANPTLAIRGEVFRSFRYRDEGWPEDYDLLLRLLTSGRQIGVVAKRLHSWRQRPDSLSRTSPAYSVERFTACKAAFLAKSFLSESDHYILWGYGETAKSLFRALRAHGKRPSRIVELHPGRVGETIHGAAVIRPEELGRPPCDPVVVSVAGAGPRAEIRADLARMGFRQQVDYICAA